MKVFVFILLLMLVSLNVFAQLPQIKISPASAMDGRVGTPNNRADGMLYTHWNQTYPYNAMCPRDPKDSDAYSYAGCPAVVMAQIVNYLQTTNSCRFDDSDDYHHNYDGRIYDIDDDFETLGFPSFPQLNQWLDSIDADFIKGNGLSDDQAAALIFACGTACTQVYTSSGSGTFTVAQAYEAYQRFGFLQARLLYVADSEMHTLLQQNLRDGYPAHLAIEDASGSIGHNVVVDGYRPNDSTYHMNFGYGGAYDGWYRIPDENAPYGMNKLEGIVLNIIPVATSVSSYCETKELIVFPNPVRNMLHLPDLSAESVPYTIFSASGMVVLRGSTDGTIHVQNLAPGFYVLAVELDDQQYQTKFLIQ